MADETQAATSGDADDGAKKGRRGRTAASAGDETQAATSGDAETSSALTPDGRQRGEEASGLRRQILGLQGQVANLEDKLAQERAKSAELADQLEQMKARLQSASVSLLPDLGADAFELLESVTIPLEPAGTGYARLGDVVTTKDPQKLQETLGTQARVYRVSSKTLAELEDLSHLRMPAR